MKTNVMKKISALVLSLLIVLAMSATAFATDLDQGVAGNSGSAPELVEGESINILKELRSVNSDNSPVRAPSITYTYTVSPGPEDQPVTDSSGVSTVTKSGVMPGVKVTGSTDGTAHSEAVTFSNGTSLSDTIVWTPSKTLDSGTNAQNFNIDFSGVNFGEYGVYRYEITEAADYAHSGVKPATNDDDHTRYLDVYVIENSDYDEENDTTANKWNVYGFACSSNNDAIEGAGGKINGFVSVNEDSLPDTYYTYNLTIKKTLEGDSANANHQFPFTVNFLNAAITQDVNILSTASVNAAGDGVTGSLGAVDSDDENVVVGLTANPTIADGGSVVYTGIPVGTKVTVYETNDIDGVTFTSSGTVTTGVETTLADGDQDAASLRIAYEDESNKAIVNSTSVNNAAAGNKTVTFKNVAHVSPTGVIIRLLPFAIIVAGAVVLLVVLKRTKAKKDTREI